MIYTFIVRGGRADKTKKKEKKKEKQRKKKQKAITTRRV